MRGARVLKNDIISLRCKCDVSFIFASLNMIVESDGLEDFFFFLFCVTEEEGGGGCLACRAVMRAV